MTTQHWDPKVYGADASFVARLGEPLLALLSPREGERVLDLGCGDGALTHKLVAAGCRVTAVDSSAEQVAAARASGLDAHVIDGEALPFEGAFDAVFSNAALHWMKRPGLVLRGVYRALVPGGRLVAEFGAAGNVRKIRSALWEGLRRRGIDAAQHEPWYFPTEAAYRDELERAGFEVEHSHSFERPTALPGDVSAWLALFAQSFSSALPVEQRATYLREVREELAPQLQSADGTWKADYVRLQVVARRTAPRS